MNDTRSRNINEAKRNFGTLKKKFLQLGSHPLLHDQSYEFKRSSTTRMNFKKKTAEPETQDLSVAQTACQLGSFSTSYHNLLYVILHTAETETVKPLWLYFGR
jgi:hypothetical protein